MNPLFSSRRVCVNRALALAASLATCLVAFVNAPVSCLAASPVERVESLMMRAALGQGPVLWFKDRPEFNQGASDPTWNLTSGGQLENRGEDPWGRPASAFGPATPAGGAAVIGSGSRERTILHPEHGGLIFFIRPGDKLGGSALIVSRGDWNDPNYFGLRIKNGRSLTVSASDPSRPPAKAKETEAAQLPPLEWSFVAVSWTQDAQTLEFRWWVGPLSAGELTEGELRVPRFEKGSGVLLVGGRRAVQDAARSQITLTGGLISQLAFYQNALADEMVKDIYLAARAR